MLQPDLPFHGVGAGEPLVCPPTSWADLKCLNLTQHGAVLGSGSMCSLAFYGKECWSILIRDTVAASTDPTQLSTSHPWRS